MPAPTSFTNPRGVPERLPCRPLVSTKGTEAHDSTPGAPMVHVDEREDSKLGEHQLADTSISCTITWMYNGESSVFGVRKQESDGNVREGYLCMYTVMS